MGKLGLILSVVGALSVAHAAPKVGDRAVMAYEFTSEKGVEKGQVILELQSVEGTSAIVKVTRMDGKSREESSLQKNEIDKLGYFETAEELKVYCEANAGTPDFVKVKDQTLPSCVIERTDGDYNIRDVFSLVPFGSVESDTVSKNGSVLKIRLADFQLGK